MGAFGTPQSRAANEEALLASEQARAIKAQEQQSLQQIITDLTQGVGGTAGPTGATGATGQAKRRQDAMIRLATINPAAANGIQKILQSGETAALDAVRKETNKGARQAKLIKGKGSFVERQKALTQLAASTAAEGKDVTRLVELSNLSESALDLELDKMLLQATDIETITAQAKPATDLDLRKQQLAEDKFTFEKSKLKAESLTEENPEVQSSQILEDGTVVFAMKNGSRIVTNPQGERVTGEAAEEAILRARDFGVEIQGRRSGERAGESERRSANQKIATAAFNSIKPIRSSILRIDRAIKLLDEGGAVTGPVAKLFPSIQEASIELDNLMNQLGLDVVSATTFGALSKGELALALDTALPTGLRPKPLAEWLRRKRKAQTSVIKQLRDTAIHLRKGGSLEDLINLDIEADIESGVILPATVGSDVPEVVLGGSTDLPDGTTVSDGVSTFVARGGIWQASK